MVRRAFTLIELLVVIAIIAMLASILIPSLVTAKQLARRTICSSNLRQLAIANHGYAAEYQGFFVLAAENISDSGPDRNTKRWHGRRSSVAHPFNVMGSPLRHYLGSSNAIKECPSFTDYLDEPSSGSFEAGCGGYGYNQSYIGGRADLYGMGRAASKQSASESDLDLPAETVMFTDAAFAVNGRDYIAYSFCEPPFWQIAPGEPSPMRPNPTIHFRHRQLAGVAWADGHVDNQSMTFSADYLTHGRLEAADAAALELGWFGEESNELFFCKKSDR